MPRFQHPVIIKVKDYLRPKRRESLIDVTNLVKRTLTPQAIKKPYIDSLKVLIADVGDVVNADIIELRVVIAEVGVRHLEPIEGTPCRMSVVNDANSHAQRYKKKATPEEMALTTKPCGV
jgi:hypothetical protein